tara:strand:- start:67498 stop:68181 length:684 start_codon:yes stop_codon:yes gene_type:complete
MAFNTKGGGTSKTFLSIYANDMVLEYNNREELEKKVEAMGLEPDLIKTRKKMKGKNEGKEVFYYVIWDISGMLEDVKIRETDWGQMVDLEFVDVDERFVISIGDVSSRFSKDFVRRVGNLDITKEVTFGTWSLVDDNGKPRMGVKMYQDDVKIEYSVAFDELPEGIKKTRGKTVKWDFSAQDDFIYDTLQSFIDENYGATKAEAKPTGKTKFETVEKKEEAHDDLPF